jgi:methyl-accepting chemotaxis protein
MKWFYNLKIAAKLMVVFIAVGIMTAAVGYIGVATMSKINDMADQMYQKELLGISYTKEANIDLIYIDREERNMLLASTAAERGKRIANIDKLKAMMLDNLEKAKGLLSTEKEKNLFARLAQAWKERERVLQQVIALASNEDLARDSESTRLAMGLGRQKADLVDNLMTYVTNLKSDNAKAISDQTRQIYNASRNFTIALVLGGALVGLGLGIFIARSISKPLNKAVYMIQELSQGHLGERLKMDSKDEIGVMAATMDQFADDVQNVVVGSLRRIADGDITMDIASKDSRDEIAPALKQIVCLLRNLNAETDALIRASKDGRLDRRGQATQFKGAYRKLVEGVNETLDAVLAPINEAATVLEKIAARDLSVRVQGEYKGDHAKIKNALNTAVNNLDEALSQVGIAAEQFTSTAGQISAGSQALAQASSEQASSLEEVSSSLQEMASMAKQNAADADAARGLADGARASSGKGVDSMHRLSEAISKIKASSDATAKIVKTIDEIAFQTNLLALNAAVEAARAGDAGKGFAVVAEEVRNLAIRSAKAAKNTANLIQESVNSAEGGVRINQEVLKNLEEINEQVKKVGEVMAKIAAASEQQSQGVDQVNIAIEQMNMVTQQTAANSEESASAAEELSGQAEEMQSMVDSFQLTNVNGAKRRVEASTKRPAAKTASSPASIVHRAPVPGAAKPSNGRSSTNPKELIPFQDEVGQEALAEF